MILTALLVVAPVLAASPSSARAPRAPHRYTTMIEPLSAYKAQSRCSPWAKPGTTAFANMLLRTYPRSRSLGIVRACTVGGTSEHKEGRAFDWGVSVHSKADRRSVKQLMHWLLKRDRFGHRHAMARRLGIQYMIWNRRIWGSYAASSGWRRYKGSNPHTDHVHFSLSWAGANKQSSFWRPRSFTKPRPAPERPNRPTVRPNRPERPNRPNRPTQGPRAIPEPRTPRVLQDGATLVDETLQVSAKRRGGVPTRQALRSGHAYLVEASGTYRYGKAGRAVADAECSAASRSGWRRDRSVRRGDWDADHLDLYIDGHDLYSETDNGQDCDTGPHMYRSIYVPERDGRAPLKIWDPTSYRDNVGGLRVRITDLAPRDRMSWRVPARAAAGATSPGSLRAGVEYQVTVTGTWTDGTGVTADAECSITTSDATWRRDRSADPYDRDADHFDTLVSELHGGDMSADLDDVGGDPAADSGDRCDATSHAYTFRWRSYENRPLNIRVQDPGRYGDNAGSLRVSVEPYVDPTPSQPRPEPEPVRTETVEVDAGSSAPVRTGQVYPRGTRLRLTARGAYMMRDGSDWIGADAECTIASDDRTWRSSGLEGWFDGRRQALGDVAVNGRIDAWRPSDGNGSCDEENHVYTFDLTTERDGPLWLVVADSDYADNAGSISVTVEAR